MSGNWFSASFSALVIAAAMVFLAFMLQVTGTGHFGSYGLVALMDNAAGLRVGTDVRISGIKVGRITALSLDARRRALVEIRVRDDLALPADSTVSITAPMMNDPALTITPGHAARSVAPGGRIEQWRAPKTRPRFTGS